MNTEAFQDVLNRLKVQADSYRQNLTRYQSSLADLQTNIKQFDSDLYLAKQRFEVLSKNEQQHSAVMELFSYNGQVA